MAANKHTATNRARAAAQLPIGDNRIPSGSVSECMSLLWELMAVVVGAKELIQADDKPGLDTTGKTLAAESLLGLAEGRCDELRMLLEKPARGFFEPEAEARH